MEEQLLCAVVHEFGPNFAFAADVLAACSQLQGIFRRASQCKEKFKQLTVSLPDLPALLLQVQNQCWSDYKCRSECSKASMLQAQQNVT